MNVSGNRRVSLGWASVGSALVIFSAIVSNAAIEQFLVGNATGSLGWGPTLFRILLLLHGTALIWLGVVKVSQKRTAHNQLGFEHSDAYTEPRRRVGLVSWSILGALTVIAFALRVWHLNSCLWFDEVLTLLDYVRPPLRSIVTNFESQNQHMLFSILAHFSIRTFGESAWAVRLPAVVF